MSPEITDGMPVQERVQLVGTLKLLAKHFDLRCCAVCDGCARADNPMVPFLVDDFLEKLKASDAHKTSLYKYFKPSMVNAHTAEDIRFRDFCLSPKTRVYEFDIHGEVVDICRNCSHQWEGCTTKNKKSFVKPIHAIWNGSLTGTAPEVLKDLNAAEVALIRPNRNLANGIVLYCDNHDGIYGRFPIFENVQDLTNSGLEGEFICVLCGPWTEIAAERVRKACAVRPQNAINACEWLKENNVYFKDIEIPDGEDSPKLKFTNCEDL